MLTKKSPLALITILGLAAYMGLAPGKELRAEPQSNAVAVRKPVSAPTPAGDYRVVALILDKGAPVSGGKNEVLCPNQPVHLLFRGERLVNWWFQPAGTHYLRQLDSTVHCQTTGLSGTLSFRRYHENGTPRGHLSVTFDLKRKDDDFLGSCRIEADFAVKGVEFPVESNARGRLLCAADALASDAAQWPTLTGPSRAMATPQPALVDDLSEARPLWRSEVSVPVSYGNAPDMRYLWRARGSGPGGGGSSPVVVDGIVYQGFYRPSRDASLAVPDWFPGRNWNNKGLDDYTKDWLPTEKDDYRDALRSAADDHIVAIDADTGRTLWETVWPQRSFNYQTHKHRGLFGVPLVAAGKVFYPNLHGHLMVMDAQTGKPLWEFPEFKATPDRPHATRNTSPFLVGDTLIWHGPDGRVVGLSVEDGSVVWTDELEEPRYPRILGVVQLDGQPRVLTLTGWLGEEAALLDAGAGKQIWRQKQFLVGRQGSHKVGTTLNDAMLRDDQLIVMPVLKDAKPPQAQPRSWRVTSKGLTHLWDGDPIEIDEVPCIATSGDVLFATGRHFVRCLDMKTGKQIGGLPEAATGSNPYIMIAGDKVIVSPEGQHGSQSFLYYQRANDNWTLLGQQWRPPHPTTTAYNTQPLVHPVVDGRLFVRGGNGIYCYDLRKQAAGK